MRKRTRILPWLVSAALVLAGSVTALAETATEAPAAPVAVEEAAATAVVAPEVNLSATSINNGGTLTVTGKAPAGAPVYLEVWAEGHEVRVSRFDNKKNKDGVRPYIFYITHEMPAYYKIFVPKDKEPILEAARKDSGWSYSKLLKDTGADVAYHAPAGIRIDRHQSTLMASIIGSRGALLPAMDAGENAKSSMQLVKTRFRSVNNVMTANVDSKPDGTFEAVLNIRKGVAPGKYNVVAYAGGMKSATASFENVIAFPVMYLGNAGTSLNLVGPFLLTLAVTIFGVLMGAGGGFILNPLLLSIYPALPHTIVAGTVTPTVLFSQASGIYNYSKIKFINWKLGCSIGLSMVLGAFIGPKLTEMVTVAQFKFAFGWILIVLALLMVWQTTPGYLAKNKKEQAILNEFKRRASESAAKK
ncbi:MAG: sulfite exporter TauE/SafE family protein [Desulfobulbus sp.]|jgi:hypothetical protein